MKTSRKFWNLVLIACLFGGVLTIGQQRAVAQIEGVDGNTYTSPTFGYSISWSDVWIPKPEYALVDEGGMDRIAYGYYDRFASVVLEGSDAFGLDLDQCAQEVIDRASDQEGFEEGASPVDAPPLEPAEGAVAHRAGFAFARDFNYLYVECRAIGIDGLGLRVTVSVPSRWYAGIQPDIVELLSSIELGVLEESPTLSAEAAPVDEPVEVIASPVGDALTTSDDSDAPTSEDPVANPDPTWAGINVPAGRGDMGRTGTYPGPGPEDVDALVVRWQANPQQYIASHPIVVDGVIYAPGATDLIALSADTGRELWRFPTTEVVYSLSAADGYVYFWTSDRALHAIDITTRTELWQFNLSESEGIDQVVMSGTVFASDSNGTVYALTSDQGTELWRYQSGLQDAPLLAASDIAVVAEFLGSSGYTDRVVSLDPVFGKPRWDPSAEVQPNGFDALAGGVIFWHSGYQVIASDVLTGGILWSVGTEGEVIEDLVVNNGRVYAHYGLSNGTGESALVAFEAETGTLVQTVLIPSDSFYLWVDDIIAADDTIYILADDVADNPNPVVIAIDASSGVIKWRVSAGRGSLDGTPVGYWMISAGGLLLTSCEVSEGQIAICALATGVPIVVPLEGGMQAQVTADATALKGAPSAGSVTREELSAGTVVAITGEAVEADGVTWWPVDYNGRQGWIDAQFLVAYFP